MNVFAGVRWLSALASVALLAFLQGCVALAPSHNPPVAAMPASPQDFLSRAAAQPGLGPQESAFRPLVADGVLAVVGGRNMADEYFLQHASGNFADFDLLVTGAAVPALAAGFDAYWNSPRVHALARLLPADEPPAVRQARFDAAAAPSHDTLPPLPAAAQDLLGHGPVSAALMHPPMKMLRGTVQVLVDDPEKAAGRAEDGDDPDTVTRQTLAAILRTQRELLLVSPYFVPGERGIAAIREGRRKGVAITLVTNSLAATDESFVSAAFACYRPMLLREGVQVVEISPKVLDREPAAHRPGGSSAGRMHVKGFVIDRRITFVGSMNTDFRSSRLNTESRRGPAPCAGPGRSGTRRRVPDAACQAIGNIALPVSVWAAGTSSWITSQCSTNRPPFTRKISTPIMVLPLQLT